jgi:uncharacterized MAPEG superfamily protein
MNAVHFLAATIAMTSLLWIPYVLERAATGGLMNALNNPSKIGPEPAAWATRAAAAHRNAIENLALFAPAVGIAFAMNMTDSALVTGAAATYFIARTFHYIVYTAGIIGLRTAAFMTGWVASCIVLFGSFQ